jgi:FixJ family two-component response regulator
MADERLVFIVDDDARVCNSLTNLLGSLGMTSLAFGSANEYISYRKPDSIACLLLDIDLPDIDGLTLQQQLVGLDHPPIIFITGNGDIPSTVQAMKAGAVDFLAKPFRQDKLVPAIEEAFVRHAKARIEQAEMRDLRMRLSRLTPREREVLPLVVSGLLNKQAAAELGISEITCQVHRGQIMRKMAAGSLADLVRMASKLEIPLPIIVGTMY